MILDSQITKAMVIDNMQKLQIGFLLKGMKVSVGDLESLINLVLGKF